VAQAQVAALARFDPEAPPIKAPLQSMAMIDGNPWQSLAIDGNLDSNLDSNI